MGPKDNFILFQDLIYFLFFDIKKKTQQNLIIILIYYFLKRSIMPDKFKSFAISNAVFLVIFSNASILSS